METHEILNLVLAAYERGTNEGARAAYDTQAFTDGSYAVDGYPPPPVSPGVHDGGLFPSLWVMEPDGVATPVPELYSTEPEQTCGPSCGCQTDLGVEVNGLPYDPLARWPFGQPLDEPETQTNAGLAEADAIYLEAVAERLQKVEVVLDLVLESFGLAIADE